MILILGTTWALQALAEARPAQPQLWTAGISVLQIGAGIWLWKPWRSSEATETRGWGPALLLLAGLQVLESLVTQRVGPQPLGGPAFGALLSYTLLVALPEEIWFRVLWPRAFGWGFLPFVGLGSLAFGLLHLSQGWTKVLFTGCLGAGFAVARRKGAGILPLVVCHGLLDWLNRVVFVGIRFRIPEDSLLLVFPLGAIGVALGVLYAPLGDDKLQNLPQMGKD